MNLSNNAKRLLALREALSLSQREMAEEFGVVHGAIGLWETGKRKIPGPVLKLIDLYERELRPEDDPSHSKVLEALDSTWLSRTKTLSNMGLRVVGKTIWYTVQEALHANTDSHPVREATQAALAKQMADTLGTMKGLPHKLGQLISYMDMEATDRVRAEYAQLQHLTPPMAASMIAEVIVEEFRQTPRQLFAQWHERPIAAASIGQVHRARTHEGLDVAVKIQYPGIREIIASDLKNVAVLERLGALMAKTHAPGALLEEMTRRFLEECDYTLEAASQERFREIHKDNAQMVIPEIHTALSSRRVLTSTFVEGKSYRSFHEDASQAEKNRAGAILWEHAFGSVLQHRTFNADPHPGNYLFQKDAVVFLDYGCARTIPDALFEHWRDYLRAVCHDDLPGMRNALIALKMIPRPEQFDFEHFFRLMRAWYEPCYCGTPFTFTRAWLADLWRDTVKKPEQEMRMTFPRELLFLNQLQWGLFSILADLEATAPWGQFFNLENSSFKR